LTKLNFYIFVPALSFIKLLEANITPGTMMRVGVFSIVHVVLLLLLSLAVFAHKSLRSNQTVLSMGAIFYNAGNYGIPLTLLAFGDGQIGIIATILVIQNFLSFTLGIWMLERSMRGIGAVLSGMLKVPVVYAVIIPLVTIMAKTRLALSYWGLIISYLILNIPLASVLLGTFFLSVPRELEESAEVDGASRVQTFFQIVTPVSLPAYASVAIIIFTQVWNEFFLALLLSSPATQTVQVVMAEAKGTTLVLYNLQMAAALITVAVPLLFFLFLGRYFIRGILAGALKG
jgi:glucose/mannose transport system permease protein